VICKIILFYLYVSAEAVRRGRGVYDNLVKVLLFSLPTNFAQGLSIFFAIIIGMQTPLTAMQVLTVNLITSVTLGIVLALEEPEKTVMDRPPRNPKAPLLDAFVAWRTFYVTTLLVVAVLGLEQWELVLGNTISEARAAAFTVLILGKIDVAARVVSTSCVLFILCRLSSPFRSVPLWAFVPLRSRYGPPLPRLGRQQLDAWIHRLQHRRAGFLCLYS
jgi:magnesium-transporting ATPase (P-type)